jgi:uncharacterized membrane protein
MIAPPLTAERLLQGLSAKSDFRDAILGDLAEEHAERAESDGVPAARRWYYREAARAAPHLLLHCVRSLRVGEVRRLVNVLFAAYFLVSMFIIVVTIMARSTLETLGMSAGFLATSLQAGGTLGRVVLGAAAAMLMGYSVASLDKKTPLASAILFGTVWTSVGTVALLIAPLHESLWNFVSGAILVVVCTTVGGMLQVRNTRFENREEYEEWRDKHVAS